MKNYLLLAGWLICTLTGGCKVAAQALNRVDEITQKVRKELKHMGKIEASYTLHLSANGSQSAPNQSVQVVFYGTSFKLNLPDTEVWYDGETQWTYVPANREVTISTPTLEERVWLNPLTLLAADDHLMTCKLGTKNQHEGTLVWELVWTPTDANSLIHELRVCIARANARPVALTVSLTDGSKAVMTLNQWKNGGKAPQTLFKCNVASLQGVDVIDLR